MVRYHLTKSTVMENQIGNSLTIIQMFNAQLDIVWNFWTVAERVKQWWGPKDFTCPVAKIDFRVGGKYLNCMRGPDGKDYWSTGFYKEIIPMKKIVATDSFADKLGNIVPASFYGMKGFPLELEVALMFEEQNGKTKMTLIHSGIGQVDSKAETDMAQGWNESFDKLRLRLSSTR